MMVIIETSIFTRRVQELLAEEEYRLLQIALLQDPESGVLIARSGGLRKKRWSALGKGKRGGSRTIYYWTAPQDQILMLMIYSKNERDDLTSAQLKSLRTIIETEYP